MFDNLRRAFREAADNFNREMARDAVPESVDRLLKGMEEEAVAAKSHLESIRRELDATRKRAAAERREADVCRRREELAHGIGDEETATIAAKFCKKHELRSQVLGDKGNAIEAELRLRESEFNEMMDQIRKARDSRSRLETTAGRMRARRSVNAAGDLFDELDRMAETIDGPSGRAGSASDPFDDGSMFDRELNRSRKNEAIDARLQELKRRMGRR